MGFGKLTNWVMREAPWKRIERVIAGMPVLNINEPGARVQMVALRSYV